MCIRDSETSVLEVGRLSWAREGWGLNAQRQALPHANSGRCWAGGLLPQMGNVRPRRPRQRQRV
eukprot:2591764-Pyramimonas_sp.AAC.1